MIREILNSSLKRIQVFLIFDAKLLLKYSLEDQHS